MGFAVEDSDPQHCWLVRINGVPLVVTKNQQDRIGFEQAIELLNYTSREHMVLDVVPCDERQRRYHLNAPRTEDRLSQLPAHWGLTTVARFLRMSWQEILVREYLSDFAALTTAPTRMHFPVIQFATATFAGPALKRLHEARCTQFERYSWYTASNVALNGLTPGSFTGLGGSHNHLDRVARAFVSSLGTPGPDMAGRGGDTVTRPSPALNAT